MQCDLDKKSLTYAFFLGLLLTLLMPVVAPQWHLTFFAPLLIIAMYQKSLTFCLSLAILCGTLLDLLSSYPTLGMHAAAYVAALTVLFPQRRNVFADSLTTLPLMTAAFSTISCGSLAGLLYLMDIADVFSWSWAATDLLILPAADGVLSFLIYILPALLFGRRRRNGNEYFLSR